MLENFGVDRPRCNGVYPNICVRELFAKRFGESDYARLRRGICGPEGRTLLACYRSHVDNATVGSRPHQRDYLTANEKEAHKIDLNAVSPLSRIGLKDGYCRADKTRIVHQDVDGSA